jgi:hypothetical protein
VKKYELPVARRSESYELTAELSEIFDQQGTSSSEVSRSRTSPAS